MSQEDFWFGQTPAAALGAARQGRGGCGCRARRHPKEGRPPHTAPRGAAPSPGWAARGLRGPAERARIGAAPRSAAGSAPGRTWAADPAERRYFLPPSRMKALLRRLPQRNRLLLPSLPAPGPRGSPLPGPLLSLPHAHTDGRAHRHKGSGPAAAGSAAAVTQRRIGLLGAERCGAGRRAGCHSARCHARCPQRLKRSAALSPLCNGG